MRKNPRKSKVSRITRKPSKDNTLFSHYTMSSLDLRQHTSTSSNNNNHEMKERKKGKRNKEEKEIHYLILSTM